jgi:UDPglucose 6-dehydrogenase
MIIGIIGNGFVGKATQQLKCKDIEILAYDINPELCDPIGLQLLDMQKCEIIFVSVPTPMSKDGSCYTNIIESVFADLVSIKYEGFIVLRSTVPVGISDKLNCYFMPEFLTEKNFINDFIQNKDWFFGLLNTDRDVEFKSKIQRLFQYAYDNDRIQYNQLHFVTNTEAEMIKLFKNCYLATKVSFCNEIYQKKVY